MTLPGSFTKEVYGKTSKTSEGNRVGAILKWRARPDRQKTSGGKAGLSGDAAAQRMSLLCSIRRAVGVDTTTCQTNPDKCIVTVGNGNGFRTRPLPDRHDL